MERDYNRGCKQKYRTGKDDGQKFIVFSSCTGLKLDPPECYILCKGE